MAPLNDIRALQRDRLAAPRARVRQHVSTLVVTRHSQIPAEAVVDRDLGKTIVICLDATPVTAHSIKERD